MKKILCLLLTALLMFSISACKVETESTSGTSSEASSTVDASAYDDNIAGLADCLSAAGYIKDTPLDMEVSFIGAESGRKYAFAYNDSPVTVEIYEFSADTAADSEVLKSVAETGTFTILSHEVKAYAAGRYLMVYSDASTKEPNVQREADTVALFEAFAK